MRNAILAGIGLIAIALGSFLAGAIVWKTYGSRIEAKYGPGKAEPAVSHDGLIRALRSDSDVQMEKDFRRHPFMIPDKSKASRIIVDVIDGDYKPVVGNVVEFVVPDLRRISYQTRTDSSGLAWAEVVKGLKTMVAVVPPEGLIAHPEPIQEIIPDKENVHLRVTLVPEPLISKETLEMREHLKDPAVRAHLNADIKKSLTPRPVWIHKHGAPGEFCIVHADPNCPKLLEIQKKDKSRILKKRQVKSESDGQYCVIVDDDGSPFEEFGAPLHCYACTPK